MMTCSTLTIFSLTTETPPHSFLQTGKFLQVDEEAMEKQVIDVAIMLNITHHII